MKSYPFTSQVTYDAEGLPQYDRAVDSAFLRKVFAQYFSDGIFYKPTSALQVVADSGMQVRVNPGAVHIQGAIGIEDAARTLAVQAAESMDRIDTVVARLDLSLAARNIDLSIVKGTAAENPQPPALTRDATVWELGLANLFVAKNTSTISQQRITDTRLDSSRCGLVAQTIGALDTQPYYTQLSAMIDDLREVIAGIEAGSEVMLKAAYGGSADGVVRSSDKLQTPRTIGNALFDGSSDLSLSQIGVPNPNLLNNSNFANPVNQRGLSGQISAPGYVLDRWKLVTGTVTLGDGVQLAAGTKLSQVLEFAAGTAAASVGTLSGSASAEYDDASKTFTITASTLCTLSWAKLEPGQTVTPWQVPSYSAELAACQRHFVRYSGASGSANIAAGVGAVVANRVYVPLILPVCMRAVPELSGNFSLSDTVNAMPITKTDVRNMSGNTLYLAIDTSSATTTGSGYLLYIPSGGHLDVSAEL